MFPIKSIFEQISAQVFTMKSLSEAKQFTTEFVEGKNINENFPLLANDPYGKSKIEAEKLVSEWCNKQNVICPTNAGPTFKHRILNKCITTSELLDKFKTI